MAGNVYTEASVYTGASVHDLFKLTRLGPNHGSNTTWDDFLISTELTAFAPPTQETTVSSPSRPGSMVGAAGMAAVAPDAAGVAAAGLTSQSMS